MSWPYDYSSIFTTFKICEDYDGIDRTLLFQKYERQRLAEHSKYTIWGFSEGEIHMRWAHSLINIHQQDVTEADDKKGITRATTFFRRFGHLQRLGLIQLLPYLVESDDADAELIHPVGTRFIDSMEEQLGELAQDAARALLHEGAATRMELDDLIAVPVLQHMENVQMIGVFRMRYRPHTNLTGAWWHDFQGRCKQYKSLYENIVN